jgi:hypothetical protein
MNRSTRGGFAPTLLFAALAMTCAAVAAQPTGTPPPPPMAPAAPAKSQARSDKPRPAIQLSPAERHAIDAAEESKAKAASQVDEGLAPTAADIKPRTEPDSGTTRIEQIYTSNRVSEVIVTPAGQTHRYIMVNREGRQPYGTTDLNSGLSVPMFFRFEFGKSTPTTPVSPPPAPSPSR